MPSIESSHPASAIDHGNSSTFPLSIAFKVGDSGPSVTTRGNFTEILSFCWNAIESPNFRYHIAFVIGSPARIVTIMYRKSFLLFAIAIALSISVPFTFAQPASSSILRELADECRGLAQSSVLDFYLPDCLDQEFGGYLEELNATGKFTGESKFLTLQARQLWMFSVFADRDVRRDECLAAAKSGYDFLIQHFFDRDQGGCFNQLHRDGSVKDNRKHAYLNSFAIYGLVAYYRASGEKDALQYAMKIFESLEDHAYDRDHGGYREMFYSDWTPITDAKESGLVGAVNTKTYNTHLHLMESFADLYRATQDPLVEKRLAELIAINIRTVQYPSLACNIDGWKIDWTIIQSPTNLRASFGHDVECAWLVLDAAKLIGWQEPLLQSWATAMVDYSMAHGYDSTHGGFYYTGSLGENASDRHKEWWVQAEAMVCMLDMYRLTSKSGYYEAFKQTFAFVKEHQIAPQGGWWASREADGSPSPNRSRTSMWQGGYHNARALLRCADLLDQLAEQN